ncbi:MAG: LysR family transcriptional regulator, partial [Pseudomonadota bacterium]
MDITQLNTFIAVAKAGSFTEASERLHITQPAISKRIKTLEERIGSPLFDRLGQRILLTDAGELLLPRATDIVERMNNCLQDIQNLDAHVGGTITLGISHYIGLLRIPPILRAFSQQYPDVQLDIHFYDSETALDNVEQGLLDLAVVTLPNNPSIDTDRFTHEVIWRDELSCVVHQTHPLISEPSLDMAALANYPAILPQFDTVTGKLIQYAFDAHDVQLTAQHPTNNLDNIKVMISTGFSPECWSMLPTLMLKDSGLIELTVEDLAICRDLGVIHSSNKTLSNASKEL